MQISRGEECEHCCSEGKVKIILKSTILTLGIFLLLPFSEIFFQMRERSIQIVTRPVDTVSLSLPKKVLPKRKKRIPPPKPKREKPRFKIKSVQKRFIPLPVATKLVLKPDIKGDFNIEIPVRPTFTPPVIEEVEKVFELSEVDSPPYPVLKIMPIYPFPARMKGIEGKVELIFVVDEEGRVTNIHVKRSTSDIFIKPAIKAVERWRFNPGIKDGKPVKTRVLLPIRFELRD